MSRLDPSGLGLDGHEAGLYDKLAEKASSAGRHDRSTAGLRAASQVEKPRPIVVGEFVTEEFTADGRRYPVGLVTLQGSRVWYTDLRNLSGSLGEAFSALAAWLPKGAIVAVENGAREGFHLLLRHLGVALAGLGWELYPLCSGSEVAGIIAKRGRESVYFTDLERCSGWSEATTARAITERGGPTRVEQGRLERLYNAVVALQTVVLSTFGVGLRGTIGATAIKSLRMTLPANYVWWKPNSLLSAMCGWGRAYRGGYSRAERFRGEMWKVDMTRAYTWALSLPLPARAALCKCRQGEECQPGVYLCRVEGHSELPVYLPVWSPDLGQFSNQYVTRYSGLAFLPQVEFSALAVAGYEVRPLWGFRFVQQIRLQGFTSALGGIQQAYGRGSPESSTAKLLGNALYGKLAQGPMREDVCYSLARPGEGWFPFVTVEQEVLPCLWVKPTVTHAGYHHIDAATVVTARVRARAMEWVGEYVQRGGRVHYFDTDGGLVSPMPPAEYLGTTDMPGEWRLAGHDTDAVVLGAKRYMWDGDVHAAGLGKVDASTAAIVREGGRVVVGRAMLGRPWLGDGSGSTVPYSLG